MPARSVTRFMDLFTGCCWVVAGAECTVFAGATWALGDVLPGVGLLVGAGLALAAGYRTLEVACA